MSNQFIEIERKFLLESFPVKFPLKKQLTTYQAYLSTEPEVRIRRSEADGRDVAHFLTIKSNGTLVQNAGSCFVVLIAALLYDRKFEN